MKPPIVIYLTRHGDTDHKGLLYQQDAYPNEPDLSWVTPVSITENGKQQMKKLARVIAGETRRIEAVFSSDQLRARQSLDVLLSCLSAESVVLSAKEIVFTETLRDVYSPVLFRRFKTQKEFLGQYKGNSYTREFTKYGESLEQLKKRMFEAVQRVVTVLRKEKKFTALMVSHGHGIRVLLEALEHPKKKLTGRNYPSLFAADYINKGEAWMLTFDENGNYLWKRRLPDAKQGGARKN